jgi:uncharacterized protein (DUF1778 family)
MSDTPESSRVPLMPAEKAQLDRSVLTVSPDAYAAFLARLDEPPRPNERLRRTMQTIPPWD